MLGIGDGAMLAVLYTVDELRLMGSEPPLLPPPDIPPPEVELDMLVTVVFMTTVVEFRTDVDALEELKEPDVVVIVSVMEVDVSLIEVPFR